MLPYLFAKEVYIVTVPQQNSRSFPCIYLAWSSVEISRLNLAAVISSLSLLSTPDTESVMAHITLNICLFVSAERDWTRTIIIITGRGHNKANGANNAERTMLYYAHADSAWVGSGVGNGEGFGAGVQLISFSKTPIKLFTLLLIVSANQPKVLLLVNSKWALVLPQQKSYRF